MLTAASLTSLGRRRISHRLVAALSSAPGSALTLEPSQAHRKGYVSTGSSNSRYAVVDHGSAYEASMKGRHGQQLALTKIEGIGKDDPPFDPFLEDELEEDTDDFEDAEAEDAIFGEKGHDFNQEEGSPYNNDGSLRWKKSQVAEFRAGAPAGGVFAIIQLAGTQHKVAADDMIVSNKLKPIDVYTVGSVHTLSDVLLVGSSHATLVGMPTVAGAEVDLLVEEITRDAKVVVYKNRRRQNSQRRNGFRRDVTLLRVLDIRMPEAQRGKEGIPRVPVGGEV